MSISTGSTDMIGGGVGVGMGGFGGFGGFGGIAPVGLIGINNLFDRDRNDHDGRDRWDGHSVLEQNVSDLRKEVQGVSTTVEDLGGDLKSSIFDLNAGIQSEFRNIDNELNGVDKTILQQSYAQSLQAFQNTQAIQTQMSNFQHATDNQFSEVNQKITADGNQTRDLLTQNLIDELRSQLHSERRGRDNREIEISVNNSNTAIQTQVAQQAQAQNQFLATMFNSLGDQVNRATNSIVSVGGSVSAKQDNNLANTKVNY